MTERESKHWPVVLVDIDTQHDFIDSDGGLYVAGSENLIPSFQLLFQWAAHTGTPVISSTDNHAKDDLEFEKWPPHCVAGTKGQNKIPCTLLDGHLVIGMDHKPVPFPSVFDTHQQVILEKPTIPMFDNPQADAAVKSLKTDCFAVFGVATEYCVRSAVEGLLERELPTAIVIDAIEAVDKSAAQTVIDKLRQAGATLTTTADVISTKSS